MSALSSIKNSFFGQTTSTQNSGGVCSATLSKLAKKANFLAAGILAVAVLSNLPTASAGGGAYMSCIQACVQGMGMNWLSTFLCPTICAPFLAMPG